MNEASGNRCNRCTDFDCNDDICAENFAIYSLTQTAITFLFVAVTTKGKVSVYCIIVRITERTATCLNTCTVFVFRQRLKAFLFICGSSCKGRSGILHTIIQSRNDFCSFWSAIHIILT